MRRLKAGQRLRTCVCGVLVASGCSHTMAPPHGPAAAAIVPAHVTCIENPGTRKMARAEFDLPAVREELESTPSPYCSVPSYHAVAALSWGGTAPASRKEGGISGVCVVQVSASGPACSPSPVTTPSPVPPLTGRLVQLGFSADSVECGSFGHALDYHWLSGQIEYSRGLGAWRLRYAPVDECDRFGGSVTLVKTGHVDHLRDGDYVRVEGHLANSQALGLAPAYKINSFRILDQPNS